MIKNNMSKLKDRLISFKTVWFFMIFVLIYYVFIGVDRYVSTISMSVRSTVQSDENNVLSPLLTVGGSNISEDIRFLQGYISSLDMLKILDEKIDLKQLYNHQSMDLFYSLSSSSFIEDYLKYYQRRVRVYVDDKTGLLNVEVEGFTPESAYLIAKTIMEESEKFINEISHKGAREQMAFAEEELLKYKNRYQKAQNDLIAFQNKFGVFDPLKQAEAKAVLVTQLETNIAQNETKLSTIQSYMNDDAPEIVILKAELDALKKQLLKERSKISADNSSQKLNDLAAKFQDLNIEVGFAKAAYEAALKAYESARIDALRKIKQLVIVQTPDLAQSPKYPERIYGIVTAFVVLSLIFGLIKLITMIVEEHRY